jgi:riboflavin transporter FmnP
MTDADGIEFTVILYGIVASNALFRVSYGVDLGNAMLVFAFLILAADWVEYQLSVTEVPSTVGATLTQFGFDVLVLIVWTFLPLVPPTEMTVYVGIVAAFVALQAAWDRLVMGASRTATRANAALAGAYGALLLVHGMIVVPRSLLFAATVALFVGVKAVGWRSLYRDAKRAGAPLSI